MAKNKKDVRARTWTFVLYPESAPENWRDILDGYHIPWVESPLHDKDVNANGTVKKAHRHVILLFDGKKSFEQVKDITDTLNAPIPQKTANTKGLVRYLIHMDNPEKHQYKREDIICHSGADIEQYFELSMNSRTEIFGEMADFIMDSEIDNYADFLLYCRKHDEKDWFDIAVNHNTLAINKLLDAMYQKHNPKNKNVLKSVNLEEKIEQAKEMKKKGVKVAVIADTLGVSRVTVYKYLNN